MADIEKVIYDIERCVCHVPDACRDCSHYGQGEHLDCMENLLRDALAMLKEQEAVVRCKECNHGFRLDDTNYIVCGRPFASNRETHTEEWYCADGERS